MHIQRIQVPHFRVLEDIDISFEKDFVPRIFPLGSLNGGGKSTLLQLIFVLLHCSAHENQKEFIQNMLETFEIAEKESTRTLAKFEIWDGQDTIELEFFCCNLDYFRNFLFGKQFSTADKDIQNVIEALTVKLNDIIKYPKSNQIKFSNQTDYEKKVGEYHLEKMRNLIRPKEDLKEFYEFVSSLENVINYQLPNVENTENFYITHYLTDTDNLNFLMCRCINLNLNYEVVLSAISEKIYLSSQATQVYLFLPNIIKDLLFQLENTQNSYLSEVKNLQNILPNFFTYDFVGIKRITEAFEIAMIDDAKILAESSGKKYGSNYARMLEHLRDFFPDKQVYPVFEQVNNKKKIVNIKFTKKDGITTLYPRDLSHGELKKLSLYIWLRYYNISDAIVLIDEVESNLHPDWQYEIIDNLRDWGETNQFILATHSYDVCQALTPAHIKELEPKLLKNG